ncbi:MAG TPA: hypothetical protein VEJ63_20290 [Planctomycetota bacterium]|nr:hypothetical protein [Planctomycetota bacterium]
MSESSEELDVLIDDYLDGRMDVTERVKFEERMSRDPQLRNKVLSATQSVKMVQDALGWVTPSEEFDSKVNSKITSISQSGFNFKPAGAKAPDKELTSKDVDAKLLADPEAAKENRRLVIIGVIAAVIFAVAAILIIPKITKKPDAQPAAPSAPTK